MDVLPTMMLGVLVLVMLTSYGVHGIHQAFDYNSFNTYDDIMTELDAMVTRCPVGLACTLDNIGNSYEGRNIPRLQLSSGSGRPVYWIDATIHPREWLAPAALMQLMDHFIQGYGNDTEVTAMIDTYDWHFLPMLNPDGYIWSLENDRDWRKNRRPNNGSSCIGTDLNRNFDTHWANDGTSLDPCDETYGGDFVSSEPETQIIQQEISSIGARVLGLMSIHAGGQMWVHPYGNTIAEQCQRTSDHQQLSLVVNAAADASGATYNSTFARGTTCEALNPASGGLLDFAYDHAGITNSFSPELRGPSYDVPPENIQPAFHEFYQGLVALVDEIAKQ